MGKVGTQIGKPKDKEIVDDAQGLKPKRHSKTMCQEKKEEEDSLAQGIMSMHQQKSRGVH